MRGKSRSKQGSRKLGGEANRNQAACFDVSFMTTVDRSPTVLEGTFKDKWYIDSGAPAHMCNDISALQTLKTYKEHNVSVGIGEHAAVLGSGSIICHSTFGTETRMTGIDDVLYVPFLVCNLVLVSRMRKAALKVIFDTDENQNGICQVRPRDESKVLL